MAGVVILTSAWTRADPVAFESVADVHDLYVWQIGRGATARSAHLFVRPPHDCHEVASLLRTALDDRYGIGRVTLQTDHADSSAHEAENCADAHTAIHTASIR